MFTKRAGLRLCGLVFALAISSSFTASARAQACHTPALDSYTAASPDARPRLSVRAALATSYATFSNTHYAGEYQGLHPAIGVDTPYVHADVTLPMYRIVRNGLRDVGIGDLAIDLRAPVFQAESSGLRAGAEFAMSVPTGDPDKQLGMGHTMLMPGAYLTFAQKGLLLIAQVAYGRAVGGEHGMHAEHAGVRPLVNPMNLSEVEHAFGLSYAVVDSVRLVSRVYGATPVFDVTGLPREALAFGVLVHVALADLQLEVHLPVSGQPFSHKTVAGAAFRF